LVCARAANHKVEKAIEFLVLNILESGRNPKPVIFHSLRVGVRLWDHGYGEAVTVAGVLHDILEDTYVTCEELAEEFGLEVSRLVEVNSHDSVIEHEENWYVEVFDRCYQAGREALIIKAADFFDNLDYYEYVDKKSFIVHLIKKAKYFIELSARKIGREKVHIELREKMDRYMLTKFGKYQQYIG
jgi:(p)ppGpp synthase/HD superfamily hydrolase